MNKSNNNGKIKKIEIRCPGMCKDRYGNEYPCNRMFFLGSPGFDIYGKPKVQTIKCPKCNNYFTVTCEIEERVIVRALTTVMRVKEETKECE